MLDTATSSRVVRHVAEGGGRELVLSEPEPLLREFVSAYHGYVEEGRRPVRGWELPSGEIPLIVNFGPPYRLSSAARSDEWTEYRSFAAGLHDVAAFHESTGRACCLQVNLTPIGAYRLFGVPMHELVNRAVALDDVLGPNVRRLEDQLFAASSWEARFAIMDRFIAARIGAARPAEAGVAWAWQQLEGAGGCIAVSALAEEIGWSRKHLVARFREQVGLPPKQVARVLRFKRAIDLLDRNGHGSWSDLALQCGYYDQSHLIRDVRAFAGCPPTELLRLRQAGTVPAALVP